MSFDIVVVGSCNTDLISYVSRLPKLGETVSGEAFQMGFGGKGANQCIAASRLGASVALVAKLGEDVFGDQYLQHLTDNGVATDYIYRSCTSGTGKASITVDKEGKNSIVIVEGANAELNVEEVKAAEGVIATAKVLVCQLEIRQEVTLAALKLAKKHNVTTILNPSPVPCNGLQAELLQYVDIICPNEIEAQLIVKQSFATIDDAILGIPHIAKLGAGVTMVTLGEQGCVYCCRDDGEVKVVKAVKVPAVDTTGAGDAFVGSLAYCVARWSLNGRQEGGCGVDRGDSGKVEMVGRMVGVACEVASLSVQQKGTQSSYPKLHCLPAALVSRMQALTG